MCGSRVPAAGIFGFASSEIRPKAPAQTWRLRVPWAGLLVLAVPLAAFVELALAFFFLGGGFGGEREVGGEGGEGREWSHGQFCDFVVF